MRNRNNSSLPGDNTSSFATETDQSFVSRSMTDSQVVSMQYTGTVTGTVTATNKMTSDHRVDDDNASSSQYVGHSNSTPYNAPSDSTPAKRNNHLAVPDQNLNTMPTPHNASQSSLGTIASVS